MLTWQLTAKAKSTFGIGSKTDRSRNREKTRFSTFISYSSKITLSPLSYASRHSTDVLDDNGLTEMSLMY